MEPIERTYKVSIHGGDEISLQLSEVNDQIEKASFKMVVCQALIEKVNAIKHTFNGPLSQIKVPTGTEHYDLLLRELVLKVKKQWPKQKNKKIVCLCGQLTVQDIHQRIFTGSRTVSSVREGTYEGTQCTFCVQEIKSLLELHCPSKD